MFGSREFGKTQTGELRRGSMLWSVFCTKGRSRFGLYIEIEDKRDVVFEYVEVKLIA